MYAHEFAAKRSVSMNLTRSILFAAIALSLPAFAEKAPPAKALKYHKVLLKHPENDTLFDRFFSSWIDEQEMAELESFLKEQAKDEGGANHAILARYQLRRGMEDEALKTYAKAIEALPDNGSLALDRARILMRRLDFESAREDLAKAAAGKDVPTALEASKLVGKSWMREGKPEEAIKVWDALLAANPGDEDLLEDLVESAAAEGQVDQALNYVEKLIKAGADPYKKTLRQLRRGDLLVQSGKSDDAIKAYTETLRQVGEGSWLEREVLAQIDKVYRKQDRLSDLKTQFIELAKAHPRRLLIHRQLAKIEAAQGDTDAAVGRFREVLKRTPGNREIREEFVRLLTEGEKFEEAAEELNKLIKLAPNDANLWLQMADLQHRKEDTKATKQALDKAHEVLGDNEVAGIRIASLLYQYNLADDGEVLLKKLTEAENATVAPSEALAAQYARANRKEDALAVLKKIGDTDNIDVLIRVAASISALGESESAYEILSAKAKAFDAEPRFLAAIAQSALAAEKPEVAVNFAVKLVRQAKQSYELSDSLGLAMRAIRSAKASAEWRKKLEAQDTLSAAETCLLASLIDQTADYEAVAKLLDGSKDPMVIHFYSALLDRRGDFTQAIAVLSRLADTDDGRKTSYFKDMTNLQNRAGLTDDALATVERWKQSAPGDKTAWITGSSILREIGRPNEAVKMTRQAVARFDDDSDLAASLAKYHEEAGQTADAEAVYWRLYDEAKSPSEQARWASSLARLAMTTGRVDELEEKLRERARGNRRSIGPILAQAELARVTRNEDKRRDLLLEAMRLQPNDIELRLQIASLEEQSGNPERVLAILEEAVAKDQTGRIRSALAQAYLRQGQTMKGMRELRAIAGKKGDDPRSIESSAAMLAGTGLYEEAIRFMRESLPGGGDWRSQYLLATMLEQDGRETEAIPMFRSLLQASGDIKGLVLPSGNAMNQWGVASEEMVEVIQTMQAIQMAYLHRNQDNRGGMGYYGAMPNSSKVGPFIMPDTADYARLLAKIHLAKMDVTDVEGIDFINDLAKSSSARQSGFAKLFEKYPDHPGLFEVALAYGAWNDGGPGMDKELLRKQLKERESLPLSVRLQGHMILLADAKEDDPSWDALVEITRKIATSQNNKNQNEVLQAGMLLLQTLANKELKIKEDARKQLTESLYKIAEADTFNQNMGEGFRLVAIATVGTLDDWITAANEEVVKYRKEGKKNAPPTNPYAGMGYGYPGSFNPFGSQLSPISLPQFQEIPLQSLPTSVTSAMGSAERGYGYYGAKPMEPEKLVEKLDQFQSPALRAYILLLANKKDEADKVLAEDPAKDEKADVMAMRGFRSTEKEEFNKAYEEFSGLRAAYASDRTNVSWLNKSLIAIASKLPKEDVESLKDELRALLIQARQSMGVQAGPMLAVQAQQLGLPELAKRFQPPSARGNTSIANPAVAGFGPIQMPNRSSSSSSSGNGTVEKMKKFSSEGKHEAAAQQALSMIRKTNGSYNRSYQLQQIRETIDEKTLEALFKIVDPGASKSLTKKLEYADICVDFGKKDKALEVLDELYQQRPDDISIAGKLAFLLPADQQDRVVKLLTKAAADEDFASEAHRVAESLENKRDEESSKNFFNAVAAWLEKVPPEEMEKMNLTWVAYHAKSYLDGSFSSTYRGLTQNYGSNQTAKGHKEYVTTAKRLVESMMRHPSLAEEAFRLNKASAAWETPDKKLDEMARKVVLGADLKRGGNAYSDGFFALITNSGTSTSGEDMKEHSTVQWLLSRLNTAKKVDEVLPPAYLKSLTGKNETVGKLVAAIANISSVKELEEVWEMGEIKNPTSSYTRMLRRGLLERAGAIPNVASFFIEQLKADKPDSRGSRYGPYDASRAILHSATLQTAGKANEKDRALLCKALADAIYGEDADFKNPKDGQDFYYRINQLEQAFREAGLDAVGVTKVCSSFYKAGIPVGSNDYHLYQSLRNNPIPNKEAAEKMFKECGWLESVDKWEPLAMVMVEADHQQGKITYKHTEVFILPRVFSYMNFNVSTREISKHLSTKKDASFGDLITAAALNHGNDKEALILRAFEESKAKLAKMSPERLEDFSILLADLSSQTLEKLPAAFQKQADAANKEKLEQLHKIADEFLKASPASAMQGQYTFDHVQETVAQLSALDMDKAIKVFLEAEKRFTTSTGQGIPYSSYTSNNLQIIKRDSALSSLYGNSNSPLRKDASIGLRFYNAIAKEPAATRFTFAGGWYDSVMLADLGGMLHNDISNSSSKNPRWLQATRRMEKFPEEVRKEAEIGMIAYSMNRNDHYDAKRLEREYADLKKVEGLTKELTEWQSAIIGLKGWKYDKPENRKKAAKMLMSYLKDESLLEVSRFQLVSSVVIKSPEILQNETIASIYADLFESYAKGERTIVSPVGLKVMEAIGGATISATTMPQIKRINKAFWGNANAPKKGGHSQIPPEASSYLFLTAASCKDEVNANKLLSIVRPLIDGNATIVIRLIRSGNYELAKKTMTSKGHWYHREKDDFVYDREMEMRFNELRKVEGIDPLDMLRLETLVLTGGKYATGDDQPKETEAERFARLTESYKANPPGSRMLRTEILSSLIRDSHVAAIILHDEVIEHAKELNLNTALQDWAVGTGSIADSAPRFRVAPGETSVIRQAAFLKLLDGDASALIEIAKVIDKQPLDASSHGGCENCNHYCVENFIERIHESAPLWVAEAIHRGKTDGFATAYEPFAMMAKTADKRKELNSWEASLPMKMAEFFAYWSGDGKKATNLRKELKRNERNFKYFEKRYGIAHLARVGARHKLWNSSVFADARRSLLIGVFTRPEMKEFQNQQPDWIREMMKGTSLEDDFLAIAKNPPEGCVSTVLPHLLKYRSDHELKNKEMEAGLNSYIAAIEACPDSFTWRGTRLNWQIDVINRLKRSDQLERAKEVYESIDIEQVPKNQMNRYKSTANMLGVEPKQAAPQE